MSEFDPSQPAILHERRNDKIVPWTGERAHHWRQHAHLRGDGTVECDGQLFDGWGNPLGG